MPAQYVSILYLFFSYREFGTIIGIQVASSLSIASLRTQRGWKESVDAQGSQQLYVSGAQTNT